MTTRNKLLTWMVLPLVCAAIAGCGGGDAEAPPQGQPAAPGTSTPAAPDTTAPTMTIASDVSADVATGPVTFTFVFSEDVGISFDATDLVVSGGTPSAFTRVGGTQATVVVTPTANTTGTINVGVAAGKFSDIAGNLNTAAASATKKFNTVLTAPPAAAPTPPARAAADVLSVYSDAYAQIAGVDPNPNWGQSTVVSEVLAGGNKVRKYANLNYQGTDWAGSPINVSAMSKLHVDFWTNDVTSLKVSIISAGKENAVTLTSTLGAWNSVDIDLAQYTVPDKTAIIQIKIEGTPAGGTVFLDNVYFWKGSASGGSGSTGPSITFDDAATTYTLTGFGGAEDSTVVAGVAGANGKVAKVVKSATAELWAGTTVSTGANSSIAALPFSATAKTMTLRVWTPAAGIPVRLKVEDAADGARSVETEAVTTVAGGWETLTFNFANPAAGTAALNLAYTYNKASVFFNFGKTGAAGGAGTYYFDELTFVAGSSGGGTGTTGPSVTFDDAATTYTLTGFGGAEDSTVVAGVAGANGKVAKVVKSATAELWAGTTVSTGANNTIAALPFSATAKTMTLRVWTPAAGIPVRLKVEDAANPSRSVETEAVTTVAGGWEVLTFNFANPAAGTAALNLAYTYNKASVFFNFGKTGAAGGAGTYYFDELTFVTGSSSGGGGIVVAGLPVTFDDAATTYTLTGFGGAEDSTVASGVTGANGKVAKVVKTATAELWAGTTVSTGANNTIATLPFSATATTMTLRVWTPAAGIPVRLKVEDAANPSRSVETEAVTTVAGGWETLTFNFANAAAGTAALNTSYTYNRASVFFNFGKTGAAGGAGTYYFDDLKFGS